VNRLEEIKARAAIVAGISEGHELTAEQSLAAAHGARLDIPVLVAALEAVLELHKPEATGYGDWVCGACISAGSHDWESTAYPCPTVQAIHQALGEGEK